MSFVVGLPSYARLPCLGASMYHESWGRTGYALPAHCSACSWYIQYEFVKVTYSISKNHLRS